jgi:hypothetical protein
MNPNKPCPGTKEDWAKLSRDKIIHSIHDFPDEINSASKMGSRQFLSLKVIWVVEKPRTLQGLQWPARLGTSSAEILALQQELKQEGAWRSYLDNIGGKLPPTDPIDGELGRFALVLQNQRIATTLNPSKYEYDRQKVAGTPMRTRSGLRIGQAPPGPAFQIPTGEHTSPARSASKTRSEGQPRSSSKSSSFTDAASHQAASDAAVSSIAFVDDKMTKAERAAIADEQVINTAAISFLQALFVGDAGRNAYWTPDRKGFQFGKSSFRAITDGHLQISGKPRSAAILEVKARERPSDMRTDPIIEWQESAQMALWILAEPFSYWTTEQEQTKRR